jgi:hypothetical protein
MVNDKVRLTVSMAAMIGLGESIKRLASRKIFRAQLLQPRFFSGLTRAMQNPATVGVRSEGRRNVYMGERIFPRC